MTARVLAGADDCPGQTASITRLKKRPGKACILASVVVETKHEQKVKIVFVRHPHKRDWLAILSTSIDLSADEIVRIYDKRWEI